MLCPDLRGHGRTGNGDETELRSPLAGDIVVCGMLRVARSHFVGTSLGGFAGYELAEYRERLSSVTLQRRRRICRKYCSRHSEAELRP